MKAKIGGGLGTAVAPQQRSYKGSWRGQGAWNEGEGGEGGGERGGGSGGGRGGGDWASQVPHSSAAVSERSELTAAKEEGKGGEGVWGRGRVGG